MAKKYNSSVTQTDLKYTYLVKTGPKENDLSAVILTGDKNRAIYDYLLAGITPQFH